MRAQLISFYHRNENGGAVGRASLAGGQPVLRVLGKALSPPCGLSATMGPPSPAATAAAQPLAALRGHTLGQGNHPMGSAVGAGRWLHKAGAQCHPVTARGRLGQGLGSTRRGCCRRFLGPGCLRARGSTGKAKQPPRCFVTGARSSRAVATCLRRALDVSGLAQMLPAMGPRASRG